MDKRTPMAAPQVRDLLERLQMDATGPDIHVGYYRRDASDAFDEITRLRAELAALREPAGDEAAAAVYGAIRGMINPFGKTWGELTEDEKQESRQIANAVAPKIRAAERERCAKVLERKARGYDGYGTKVMLEAAAAIRAGADDAG